MSNNIIITALSNAQVTYYPSVTDTLIINKIHDNFEWNLEEKPCDIAFVRHEIPTLNIKSDKDKTDEYVCALPGNGILNRLFEAIHDLKKQRDELEIEVIKLRKNND